MKLILISSMLLSFYSQAASIMSLDKYKIDKKENNKEFKIAMTSGKHDGERFFKGVRSMQINSSAKDVLKSVLNFKNRCNNELSDKRISISKSFKCQYLSKSLIETIDIKEILPHKKQDNEIQRYAVTRRVYNREHFQYHEVIKVFKEKGAFLVTTQMLSDKQAKKTLKNPIKKVSVLTNIETLYKIEEVSKNKSKLTYTYITTTDHWLLNKSVAASQFFDGMAKSIDRFFNAVSDETKILSKNEVK